MNSNNFIILGNGGGGTSLFRGLINAHPDIHCKFEYGRQIADTPEEEFQLWLDKAEKHNGIWGNKVPIEQFISRQWLRNQIVDIVDHFKVIWIFRRFSKYLKPRMKHDRERYKQVWELGLSMYWQMREKHPDKVIQVSFEDILLRTEMELIRVCYFLNVDYDPIMLTGCKNTGHKQYNQDTINLDKL